MEITETPQTHGLNHNHYLSSKICFSFVPNIILNSFYSLRYKISSPLTPPSPTKMPILTKSIFPQCPQLYHLLYIPPTSIYQVLISICTAKAASQMEDGLETKKDKWRPSCQHLCLTDICPFASSGQKLTFLKACLRLKLRPHHNMISTFLSGPITCLSCLCIWALPSKQIRQIPQSASSWGFALPVLFHTCLWKFNSSFKSRFVFQTTLQNPT